MIRSLLPALLALVLATPGRAAAITVLSGGAPKEALAVLIPRFEARTGHRVTIAYDVVTALRQRIAGGEAPDMALLPDTALAELARASKLRREGSAPFGTVRLVAIAPQGRPLPDVSTPERFRDALLNARSVVYATPTATPSGAHMAQVVARLGIADALAPKLILKPALEGGAALVAAGEAEIGVYPLSEVVRVAGVARIGPLPSALQLSLTYGGAVLAANAAPEPALALIRFLAADESKPVWRDAGFDPP